MAKAEAAEAPKIAELLASVDSKSAKAMLETWRSEHPEAVRAAGGGASEGSGGGGAGSKRRR